MDKHPKEMTNKELFKKLKEDGVNAKAASTVRGKGQIRHIYFFFFCYFFGRDE